ncbi:MAG: flavodoxin family protein, partial [Acidimicrobiales bacterium]
MNVVVIYESLTGNTKKAAERIGSALRRAGAQATVCPVNRVDYEALSQADLVAVGAWTDGFVMFGQRPGRAGRLKRLPAMKGKKAVVFCTYAIDQGKV